MISDARLIVHQLRLHKSSFEQSKMLDVGALSADAHARAMQACRPGMMEWELQNVIERSLVLCEGKVLDAADIRIESLRGPRPQAGEHMLPEGMTLDEYEQSIIRDALQRAEGNKSQAARLLGLTRNALRYRLAQMGLE